jgi:hypothetical protein
LAQAKTKYPAVIMQTTRQIIDKLDFIFSNIRFFVSVQRYNKLLNLANIYCRIWRIFISEVGKKKPDNSTREILRFSRKNIVVVSSLKGFKGYKALKGNFPTASRKLKDSL